MILILWISFIASFFQFPVSAPVPIAVKLWNESHMVTASYQYPFVLVEGTTVGKVEKTITDLWGSKAALVEQDSEHLLFEDISDGVVNFTLFQVEKSRNNVGVMGSIWINTHGKNFLRTSEELRVAFQIAMNNLKQLIEMEQ